MAASRSAIGRHTARRGWLRTALRSAKVLVGLGIVVFFILLGVIGPLFVGNPSATGPTPTRPRRRQYPLGTTDTGQNVLAQLVDGTSVSLIVGFVASAIATLIAVGVGLSSAFLGGIWDEILSTITNVFLVIPALPLVIVLAGYLHGAGTRGDLGRDRGDRLAVDGAGHARADAVPAPARLRTGGPHRGRVDATHHLVRDRAERDPADRRAVPDHSALRDPDPGGPGLPRRRLGHHLELGHHAVLGAERRGARRRVRGGGSCRRGSAWPCSVPGSRS